MINARLETPVNSAFGSGVRGFLEKCLLETDLPIRTDLG